MNRPILTVAGQASEVVASDGSVVLNVPITLRQRSGRRVVAVDGSGCESGERFRTGATPLQLALARGQRWLRMLEAGEVSSLREIAKRDGTDHFAVHQLADGFHAWAPRLQSWAGLQWLWRTASTSAASAKVPPCSKAM